MSVPLLPGYRRDEGKRGQFHKSQVFGVAHGSTLVERRDFSVDPRAFTPASSFNGTGTLQHVGASIVQGASQLTSGSGATPFASSGRLGPNAPEVEANFASGSQRAALDRYAHLRRAPVASDFANTAEPRGHLPVLGEPRLPAFVEYDRKVLRFSGYFKEAVHASAAENWRVRPILLYYYLEDDTLHIAEPPVANAGLPQGVFVKRHRVPKSVTGETFGVEDLAVGAELAIYGRAFRLTGADAFTRAFYEQNGAPLLADEPTPQDPFSKRSATAAASSHRKTTNAMTAHQEARLGKHMHGGIEATQKFLKNDGKVLRFYATWDDEKLYGEKHPYIIHFFLADDTVEVLEVSLPNSGRANFPCLLKRARLPRDHTLVKRDVAHVGGSNAQIYDEEPAQQHVRDTDLRVGGTLDVYGRSLLLCGVDANTRKYYHETYGMPLAELESIPQMKDEPAKRHIVEVPPETGFGSPEDSLGSFLYLVPKAPKTDQKKLHECDGVLLRFMAKFANPAYVDKDREFVVTYYLANDTMQIFENFERNAGHIGGKFLDRQRCMNERTGHHFAPQDLFVGGRILVFKTEFVLLEADEYTKQFMIANPKLWNQANGNVGKEQEAIRFNGGKPFSIAKKDTRVFIDRRPF